MAKSAAVPARSTRTRAFSGAALVVVANLLIEPAQIIAPVHAEPAYTTDAVVYFFTHEAGRLCIGTEAACPVATSEGRLVLVNFEAGSAQLTQVR